jgi:two-component system, OmpR family, phosphate regulon sensor histidine kinase PhoR
MANEKILLVFADTVLLDVISRAVLLPAGYQISTGKNPDHIMRLCCTIIPDLVILEAHLAGRNELLLVRQIKKEFPTIQIILFAKEKDPNTAQEALQAGVDDLLNAPVRAKDVLQTVQRVLVRRTTLLEWTLLETRRNTQPLEHKLEELEILGRIGRSVTASLDLDSILSSVVEAAVDLTHAEQGSLLLVDPGTGELYIRAEKNFGEKFVQTSHVPADDTLAGQVITSGEPVLFNRDLPQKINTAHIVQSLIYVPLHTRFKTIGVLGVNNREKKEPFLERDVTLLSTLADYASIAIENARLFDNSEIERRKLNTILTNVIDGVIVVDFERQIIFVNPTARDAFGISSRQWVGRSAYDVISHPDLLKILHTEDSLFPIRREIFLENGRVLNAQATAISEVGLAITMQDITQIKKLDRIKSEFVSAVSHDLRSPLTAILGYVELLHRVGPLNDAQQKFIQRVHASVQNITHLINELLDLGRIEAGLDDQKETFNLEMIIQLVLDEMRPIADTRSMTIMMEVPPDLPPIFASPTHIQQMLTNLVGNALKYTSHGGWVKINVRPESDQFILQVSDNGPGIPLHEQQYIFDRFYRASNVDETDGSGLGLAIVKSVVESHQGRIWVESSPGHGAVFTIVLPMSAEINLQTMSEEDPQNN